MKIFKKRHIKFMLVVICTIRILNINAQQPFNFVSSPNSSQPGSVVNQVNQFTGKFGMSIPIYSYSGASSNLKLNVSIDYSTGGLNLNQDPSSVGTGWNLNAGGIIHREIIGIPDDLQRTTPSGDNVSGYCYTPEIGSNPCSFQYRSVGYYDNPDDKVKQDSEPDEFNFNFLGMSGSFNIPKGGLYVGGPKVITKPQSNLEFSFFVSNNPYPVKTEIREIVIKDDNGLEYHFTGIQTTGKMKVRTVQNGTLIEYHYEYDYLFADYVTDWLLTKIKDNNSSEEINLVYEDFVSKSKFPTIRTDYYNNNTNTTKPRIWDDQHREEWGKLKRLKNINFPNGDNVVFEYDANNRCDFRSDKALLQVKVNNGTNNVSYGLNYTYYQRDLEIPYGSCTSATEAESLSKWLFLKSVKKATSSESATIASFDYIRSSDKITGVPDNYIPSRKTVTALRIFNQDYWGFYNGGDGANRPKIGCLQGMTCTEPKAAYAEIGSLKKINYPSGGYSTIEYEGNTVSQTGTDVANYGIRVKKITDNDGISSVNDIIKEYHYIQTDGTSSGFAMPLPPDSYNNEMNEYPSTTSTNFTVKSSVGVLPPVAINGSPVGYERVEEISTLGKVVNEYASFNTTPPIINTFAYPFSCKQRTADWAYGLLKKQTVMDQSGTVVKTVENTYNTVINTLNTPAYKAMKTAYLKESNATVFGQSLDPLICAQTGLYWKFTYETYYPVTGRAELLSVVEKNYLKDGSILSNKIDYEYDPNTFNLKKSISYNSANEKMEKILFYPAEYPTGSTTYKLVQRGITSLPVSSISLLTKSDGSKYITGLEKTEFQQMLDFSVRPLDIQTMKSKDLISISPSKITFTPEENYGEASTKLSVDLVYDKFDGTGNLLQSTAKQIVQSIIWDNEQKIITAKANAPVEDIAYTSFETLEKGNWAYSGKTYYELNSPTGKRIYDLTGNAITRSGLNSAKSYFISYWSSGGAYLVNGNVSPIVSGIAVNGWRFFTHRVSGVTSVSITGTGMVDEMRMHPENSRMTSVTYEPLIGLTSESGIDGQITKYSYDAYGRLQSIKDERGNISKVFCYNSQGAPSACGEGFRNAALSVSLYKTSCPTGYVSPSISYTVPQGRYVSFISQQDADNLAAKDAQIYGQSFADRATATCVPGQVYARLSYENVYTSSTSTYGDIVVRFYSDAAGRVPVSVSNLTIEYSEYYSQNGQTSSYSQIANGTYIVLSAGTLLEWEEVECDYGSWPCYTNTYSYSNSLIPSSSYQIIN